MASLHSVSLAKILEKDKSLQAFPDIVSTIYKSYILPFIFTMYIHNRVDTLLKETFAEGRKLGSLLKDFTLNTLF